MSEIGAKDFVRVNFEVEAIRHQIKKSIIDYAEGLNSLVDKVVSESVTEEK